MRISVSSLHVCCGGRTEHHWKLGLSQSRFNHAHRTRDTSHSIPSCLVAFLPCYFPLWVSPPGRAGVLKGHFALNLLPLWGYSTSAEAAHSLAIALALVPLPGRVSCKPLASAMGCLTFYSFEVRV